MKKLIKIILAIVIIGLLIFVGKKTLFETKDTKEKDNTELKDKEEKPKEPKPDVDYREFITDSSESNKEKIKEFISEGMDIETFKKTLSRIAVYVEKTDNQYEPVNYNFERHYKYEELEEIYKQLNHSEIVKLEIIGNTYDGRNMYSIEIGKGTDTTMYEGNIHAAEIGPVLFLTKYAVDLVNNWESGDEATRELLANHKIVILPTMNPDGYNYSLYGKDTISNHDSYIYQNDSKIEQDYYKANINGVDLNRNLPSQTGGLVFTGMYLYGTTSRTKSPYRLQYFPGESLGSEPETQALIYWMYKHYKNTHAYIAVHSAGRVIYNGKQYLSDRFNELSDKCAKVVNRYTGYTIIGIEYDDDGRGTDGTTTDMMAEIAHGYKFSSETGRLSVSEYAIRTQTMDKEMCVMTVETMEKYTQNLSTIKSEYVNKKLENMFTAIVEIN